MYAAELLLSLSLQLQEVKGQLLAQNAEPPQLSPPCVVLAGRTLITGGDRGAAEAAQHTLRSDNKSNWSAKNSPPIYGEVFKRY